MDPYNANPGEIPPIDSYADLPFYGRYLPRDDDFRTDPQHVRSQSEASMKYWESVLDRCDESVRIYPADQGGRDVFALGTVIIKSSHLHPRSDGDIDFSYADRNEVEAIDIARGVLTDVDVPEILFAAKVVNMFPATLLRLFSHHSLTHPICLDQRPLSPRSAEITRRWFECRLALSITESKTRVQTPG